MKMNRSSTFALIYLCTSIARPSSFDIPNPGFESGISGWNSYVRQGDQLSTSLDGQNCWSGDFCLRVRHYGAQDWSLWPVMKNIQVLPGQIWEYSSWVRTDSMRGHLGASFITRNNKGEVIAWNAGVTELAPSSSLWSRVVSRITIPDNCVSIMPRITGWGNSEVIFDNLEVRPINLLSNSGFEQGLSLWRSTSKSDAALMLGIAPGIGVNGSNCLSLTHSGPNDWALFQPSAKVYVEAGDVWDFSVKLRVDSIQGSIAVSFVTQDSSGAVLNWNAAASRIIKTQDSWVMLRSKLLIPLGTATIQPRLTGWGKSSLFVDDIQFSRSERAEAHLEPRQIANDSTIAVIDPYDLSISIIDRFSNDTIHTDGMPDFRTDSASRMGDTIRLAIHHLDMQWPAQLKVWLVGGSARLSIVADSSAPLSTDFLFPGPIHTKAGQRLAMPRGTGLAWPVENTSPEFSLQEAEFWQWQVSQALSGATDGKTGFVVSIDQPWDSRVIFKNVSGLLRPFLYQTSSKSVFGKERSIVIAPIRGDGWVGMARRHRQRLDELKRVRTWAEKIEKNPKTKRLEGAVDYWVISRNWPTLSAAFIDSLRMLGMERAIINWSNLESRRADSIVQLGYILSGYHSFPDAVNDPKYGPTDGYGWGTIINSDGTMLKGFENKLPDGSSLWFYLNCSQIQPQLAHYWYANDLLIHPRNGQFLDVTLAGGLHECWSSSHPTTRGEDAQYRTALLRYVRDTLGLLLGSEQTRDFAHTAVDWGEGPMTIKFTANAPWDWSGPVAPEDAMDRLSMDPAIRVPLLPLTDHDAFAPTWYSGDGQSKVPLRWNDKDAWNALYATMPLIQPATRAMWDTLQTRYLRTINMIGSIHAQCGFAAMIGYEELTPDRTVQQTRFSNGWTVVANFGKSDYVLGSDTLPPQGYVAWGSKGRIARTGKGSGVRSQVKLDDRWYYDPEEGGTYQCDGVRSTSPIRLRKIDSTQILVSIIGNPQYLELNYDSLLWRDAGTIILEAITGRQIETHRKSDGWVKVEVTNERFLILKNQSYAP